MLQGSASAYSQHTRCSRRGTTRRAMHVGLSLCNADGKDPCEGHCQTQTYTTSFAPCRPTVTVVQVVFIHVYNQSYTTIGLLLLSVNVTPKLYSPYNIVGPFRPLHVQLIVFEVLCIKTIVCTSGCVMILKFVTTVIAFLRLMIMAVQPSDWGSQRFFVFAGVTSRPSGLPCARQTPV